MSVYLLTDYMDGGEWFKQAWAKTGKKLDMGKSCVRFKRLDQVPLDVIGEVIAKVPPALFIERYEAARAATGRS
jgi:hypothetical protein